MDELQITPAKVKALLDRGEKFLLVDVREPWETQLCAIAGAQLLPMGSVPANLQKLDVEGEVVCYCHHGVRSLDVAAWLRSQGVVGAKSMTGGIDRWSAEIDPTVPRY
jgi:rhodanese-related sulfurtransferase